MVSAQACKPASKTQCPTNPLGQLTQWLDILPHQVYDSVTLTRWSDDMKTYTVTITRADGYVFNHQVRQDQLRQWLADAATVLLPGETLSYVAD